MQTKLTLGDRYLLARILPAKGNFLTLSATKELERMLPPTEEEKKKFGAKITELPNGAERLEWNHEVDTSVEFDLTETMVDIFAKWLSAREKEEELPAQYFDLYKKFVKQDKD